MTGALAFDPSTFLLVLCGAAAGIYGERWRARSAWRARRAWSGPRGVKRAAVRPKPEPETTRPRDSADQLRVVSSADFTRQKLLSKSEARVLYLLESEIALQGLRLRVMAQVSLGEVLRSPDRQAFGCINSKRVDLLIITAGGDPLAAVEFQGGGHYQGDAPARDAVKKEALRRAGVRYEEVSPDDDEAEVRRVVTRLRGKEARAA